MVRIINVGEFEGYWREVSRGAEQRTALAAAEEILARVRAEGDEAVRRFAARFDRGSPLRLEVPQDAVDKALANLRSSDGELARSLEFAADNIWRFALLQRAQFADFEKELVPGLFTGQRVIPVSRAALYAPGGRFPLISTVLMGLLPAFAAGVEEVCLFSPPREDGIPDRRILAAAGIAVEASGRKGNLRVFAVGGAQAIAASAWGTESIPRADVIAGPGNSYVAAAKRLLTGIAGIDLVAGPTDVLVITGGEEADDKFAAADMLAQAEHDVEARARALVPSREAASRLNLALERAFSSLPSGSPSAANARTSLEAGGAIIVYRDKAEAVDIANLIAPEHLELQVRDAEGWVSSLRNYGSLFIGKEAAEVLGDYSAGINHTLPTSGIARFSGGLSVRHFLKTVTTLRASSGEGYQRAVEAAGRIARAEGLTAHALSADCRAQGRI